MSTQTKLLVNVEALKMLLSACTSSPHHVAELMATRGLQRLGIENCIDTLMADFQRLESPRVNDGSYVDLPVNDRHAVVMATVSLSWLKEHAPHLLPPAYIPKWTCFHCSESFTDAAAAQEHFGKSERQEPGCKIDIAKYREMEERVRRCDEEDSDVHREMHGMASRHQQALRREEEKGYARGLEALHLPQEMPKSLAESKEYCDGEFSRRNYEAMQRALERRT